MKKEWIIVALLIGGVLIMAQKKNPLTIYQKKRNFTHSPEPKGAAKKKKTKQPIFVIQEHAARSLHYDFRLEIDGVLKSWAVPKGPSLNSSTKRLAIPTEDHPMEYATFEGIIPQGLYGAGPVIVWDKGTYRNIKEKDSKIVPMDTCYKEGTIEIFLKGKKLKGKFALIRTKPPRKQWLLIKMRDEYADARRKPTSSQPESVLSGKTIKELKREEKKEKKNGA
ncbi:MAG: DNA polymerase ligase N-terminal domain-containing protein [Candidatus Babeliales bacterium]|jgi:DNA ligase D-like protein (predicted 3'-phosphoesterase)